MHSQPEHQALYLRVIGIVQGVGFRPFVHGLANQRNLAGWVRNTSGSVEIEAEGTRTQLEDFLRTIEQNPPPGTHIYSLEAAWKDPSGHHGFTIVPSLADSGARPLVLADLALCTECQRELLDPSDRRFRYPFINCTHCGPRFSIIQAMPYDRTRTTMNGFTMCPDCLAEYENPADRRFHAQPNACPNCGPKLSLTDRTGRILAERDDALKAAADILRRGKILAVKGLGGFHLTADARNETAVALLRRRKRRGDKPFAVMVPSLVTAQALCEVSSDEARLLTSPEAPIVLLTRKPSPAARLAPSAAPDHPLLGLVLPYTPLHLLLLEDLGGPMVATSGNLADEPICIDNQDALQRLGDLADLFLMHDRPIQRQVDDSIVRWMGGQAVVLRRARGYAPLPLPIPPAPVPVRAAGGFFKNSIALAAGSFLYTSQHIGDLETLPAVEAFREITRDLEQLLDIHPQAVAIDLHPDYPSTRETEKAGLPLLPIQHHHAHMAACMADNQLDETVLAFTWDGTGLGTDHTAWGGEALVGDAASFERFAALEPFSLPGGDQAAREPRRAALSLLYALAGRHAPTLFPPQSAGLFTPAELNPMLQALEKHLNTPLTSSMGRLFDAAAALCGLASVSDYEGQAAAHLEYAAMRSDTTATYPFTVTPGSPLRIQWGPMIRSMLGDLRHNPDPSLPAAAFHNTLAEIMCAIAQQAGQEKVLLTGGCFQNRLLLEKGKNRLQQAGFRVYHHQRIPPNDGGLAAGQAYAALHQRERISHHVPCCSR